MREQLVVDLYERLLGPRNGLRERMDRDPLEEYLCGILQPREATVDPADVAEASASLAEDTDAPDADDREDEADPASPFDETGGTALDPGKRPSSIGLGFQVGTHASRDPAMEVCLTWARYRWDSETRTYVREPRFAVLAIPLPIEGVTHHIPVFPANVENEEPELDLEVVCRRLERGYSVTVRAINALPAPPEGTSRQDRTWRHIFQPQIRIALSRDCHREPLPLPGLAADDDRQAEARYRLRQRHVYARGFLCSATWRERDPQLAPGAERLGGPFTWADGALLDPEARRRFQHADLRTEYFPMAFLPAPDFSEPAGEDQPELSAARLAQCWKPEVMEQALRPLATAYAAWIAEVERILRDRQDLDDPAASRILDRNRRFLARLERAIRLLRENADARLAFCFANQAIALQAAWGAGRPRDLERFRWRRFQLAFLLAMLPGLADPDSPDRAICDVLWAPTGGGKTETYLALMAFALAYRRRTTDRWCGTTVLSRYTLRLLTLQQFRRTLRLVTACEALRVEGLETGIVGWRPRGAPPVPGFLWGGQRFSIGLWVGGGVTPNRLDSIFNDRRLAVPGAIDLLKEPTARDADPAVVLQCPSCNAWLAAPPRGIPPRAEPLVWHLPVATSLPPADIPARLRDVLGVGTAWQPRRIQAAPLGPGQVVVTVEIATNQTLRLADFDRLAQTVCNTIQGSLLCTHGARPGYVFRTYRTARGRHAGELRAYDFEIVCPNPGCPLVQPWGELTPSGGIDGELRADRVAGHGDLPEAPVRRGCAVQPVQAYRRSPSSHWGTRIPIPALTVDEQIWRRAPSIVVATADKIARLPAEERTKILFGNVQAHHPLYGFDPKGQADCVPVHPLPPPLLVVQDELHLISGPLGSLAGLFEAAVDALARERGELPKYIASTATVTRAGAQVEALYARQAELFPPGGPDPEDAFFLRTPRLAQESVLDDSKPGRLYVGVAAPGRGPLSPVRDIWASLLAVGVRVRGQAGAPAEADPFWTVVGYFNAIRELARTRSLYRQDVRERLEDRVTREGHPSRPLDEGRVIELSSRTASGDLPAALDAVARALPDPGTLDAVFTTSMFGTGVDVDRLGLMVVHGQPKSMAEYLQATGRVGRRRGALVVTFLRASRPRDLTHYEFFVGFHLHADLYVEPVTVFPLAPGVLGRALGPVTVAYLRNRPQPPGWTSPRDHVLPPNPDTASVQRWIGYLEARNQAQPASRRLSTGTVSQAVRNAMHRWRDIALHERELIWVEYFQATKPVVLGDAAHRYRRKATVFADVPQSLREVDETLGFET